MNPSGYDSLLNLLKYNEARCKMWKMNPLYRKALLRTLSFCIWILFSACLFALLEKTEKDDAEVKYELLRSLYKSMASKYNMSIEEFNSFCSVAYEAMSEPKSQWHYHEAVDFAFQTLTTIGYGYITPQTTEGQILCIFVSLLGIPITMLAFKSVGEVIVKLVNTVVVKFENKILKRPEPKQVQTKSAVILFFLMLISLFIGGLMQVLKNLTLVEGVYFWFVTCTTIGFGDYVPYKISRRIKQLSLNSSSESPELQQTDTGVLLFMFFVVEGIIGLCVVSSVLNSIMAAMEERKWRPRRPRCIPRKTKQHVGIEENNASEHRDTDMTLHNVGCQTGSVTPFSANEIE